MPEVCLKYPWLLSEMHKPSFVPEWLSSEVDEALTAIQGEHTAKKEATVLRLAEATANGDSWTTVFGRADTCTKRVWYGFTKPNGARKAGWCEDPAIQAALGVATDRARWWVRVKRGRAVQDALDALVDGSEDAAGQLRNLVRHGRVLFQDEQGVRVIEADVKEVLMAARDILDRVSELTAAKGAAALAVNADQMAALMRQAEQQAQLLAQQAEEAWSDST